MAGYKGYSMSNNAVDAYNHGEKPLSRWSKSDILDELKKNLNSRCSVDLMKYFEKMKLEELKSFLSCSSWHHTSSHYNRTDFFSIDETKVVEFAGLHQEKKYIYKKDDGTYLSTVANSEGRLITKNASDARRMTAYEVFGYVEYGGSAEEILKNRGLKL